VPVELTYSELADRVQELETANRELRTELLHHREAVGAGNIGLWEWDLATDRVIFSDVWKKQLGYDENEIGDSLGEWRDRLHPDDVEPTLRIVRQSVAEARVGQQAEFRLRHKDGTYRWILVQASVIPDDSDRPVKMWGVHIDITERKQMEVALADSREQYRLLYENAPLAYQSLDDEGRFIDVNPAWLRTLGYERDEVLGQRYADFLHPEWKPHFEANFPEFKRRGYIHDLEFRLRHKAGHYLDVAFEGCVGYTPEGDFRQTYCVFQDITSRKRAEAENLALQARIQQAQKMESIGNLAGGIAHDFNNLLFPIIGMSEMLLETLPAGSPEHEDVQQILAAGKRAGQLVEQILAFSRQSEHRLVPIRIQQVLREVVKLTRALIPADIEIREDICSDCGSVLADQTQIHQVVMNLITNALHAMEGRHGTISITLKEQDLAAEAVRGRFLAPGRHAILTVSDTGPGIDPALMDRIFEPYFTTKDPGKGTGLGLAMVYGIVKEHGGDIRVDSAPGRGTTFEIHLPIMARSVAAAPAAEDDRDLTGDEHVLLVDDEPAIARLETQMLEQLGYRVTSRVSSTEALEAFRANPEAFDLVLTDMTMPDLTGDELAHEILALRPELPVIICTGFSERIDADSATAMGIRAFLMKPVLRLDMARAIRDAIDGRGPT